MARVLKGSHSFTCTLTRSSAIGMSHTCLCTGQSIHYQNLLMHITHVQAVPAAAMIFLRPRLEPKRIFF